MIELVSNGVAFTGWTAVSISASMESLARSFNLDLHGEGIGEPSPLLEGSECKITRNGRDVVLGYVFGVSESEDSQSHDLRAVCRSFAGDLVDCSARHQGSWRGVSVRTIAQDLLRPFGLFVVSDGVDLESKVRKFALQESDTVHEALERLARAYGFLWTSSAQGDIVATMAGSRRSATEIRRGVNIISSTRDSTTGERFSEYSVVAQQAGDDSSYGSGVAHIRHTVQDDGVLRYRPTSIVAETQLDRAGVKSRAQWERAVRYGRSQRMSYHVKTWETDFGIWEPNILHHVSDQRHNLDEDMLLASVTLTYSEDSGETAQLELVRPEAFAVNAVPPRKRKKEKGRTDLGGFG